MTSSSDLSDSQIEPASLRSLALLGGFLTINSTWEINKCIHVCVKERKLIITYGLHFDGSVHNALCPITSESTVTFYFKTCCLGPSKSVS